MHIFLDLNQWIYLSRDHHGKLQQKGHNGIASTLLKKVQKDEVRIPLGIVHFLEHLQNENVARRERLAEVFELYSRGWCFASWSDICDFEVRQALHYVFDGLAPTRPTVFGRGFVFTASAKGTGDPFEGPHERISRPSCRYIRSPGCHIQFADDHHRRES